MGESPRPAHRDYDAEAALRHFRAALDFATDPFDLAQDLGAPEPPLVVDVRPAESHRAAHIPGAVSLPYRTIDADTVRALDPKRRVVVYCNGVGCNASTKAALRFVEQGFMVQELEGGLVEWKRQGHDVASAPAARAEPATSGQVT